MRRAASLAQDAERARNWSIDLKSEAVRVSDAVARTEEELAASFDRLAEGRPEHADRLRAKRDAAAEQAARSRQWAEDHAQ